MADKDKSPPPPGTVKPRGPTPEVEESMPNPQAGQDEKVQTKPQVTSSIKQQEKSAADKNQKLVDENKDLMDQLAEFVDKAQAAWKRLKDYLVEKITTQNASVAKEEAKAKTARSKADNAAGAHAERVAAKDAKDRANRNKEPPSGFWAKLKAKVNDKIEAFGDDRAEAKKAEDQIDIAKADVETAQTNVKTAKAEAANRCC